MSAVPASPPPLPGLATMLRLKVHWTDRIGNVLLVLAGVGLAIFLLAPLATILMKSVEDKAGAFIGLTNFEQYFHTPSLAKSIWNSVWVSTLVTAVTIPLAFTFAYALTRSCVRYKALLRNVALVPILAPSLLAAISFIFWFGNQGVLKSWLMGSQIYGAPGIVISMVFATFPHALMILVTALSLTDARLYEAADALGTSTLRRFWTITLPGAKYGIISAWMVVFTYALSDFGIPKVIGGNFNMLATDIFKLVIGQQDFPKGAVVAIILLLPVAVTYVVDSYVQKRQSALLSARSVPFVPKPSPAFDWAMATYCWLIAAIFLAVLGMAMFGSLVKLWPYNFSLVLDHYRLGLIDAGVIVSWWNSVQMAFWCATLGAAFIFMTSYLMEKTRGVDPLRPFVRLMAVLPMGVPGMVLGLGYIFFFVREGNPLHFLYGSMAILVICTTVHYYTSSHLTAVTALKQIDNEFEAVSASLRVPFWRTLFKVTVPVCLPAMLDISRYLFVNAMTTVSAVVFLYSPQTTLASVAIVNLDEAGDTGPAAAMATLVVLTSAAVCVFYYFLQVWLDRRTQSWRSS
ncbi:MAG: putative 2-aminoethylphosphonate ABC transporter permease subunit [Usitatibacter sp.]